MTFNDLQKWVKVASNGADDRANAYTGLRFPISD